jgi:hypothetical protein
VLRERSQVPFHHEEEVLAKTKAGAGWSQRLTWQSKVLRERSQVPFHHEEEVLAKTKAGAKGARQCQRTTHHLPMEPPNGMEHEAEGEGGGNHDVYTRR